MNIRIRRTVFEKNVESGVGDLSRLMRVSPGTLNSPFTVHQGEGWHIVVTHNRSLEASSTRIERSFLCYSTMRKRLLLSVYRVKSVRPVYIATVATMVANATMRFPRWRLGQLMGP